MKPTYALLTFALGVASALIIVVSCGDSTQAADAAGECDCPEAERPLAGRINQVFSRVPLSAPTMFPGASVTCPGSNGVLLGGSCHAIDPINQNDAELVLYEHGPDQSNPNTYICEWKNPLNLSLEAVEARAICLSL